MKTKKLKTLQKPIEIDLHLKYRCPECGQDHWLSQAESQTKKFKIVCVCGLIFRPKRLKKIKLVYSQAKKSVKIPKTSEQTTETKPVVVKMPEELRNKTSRLLLNYGFIKKEADELVEKAYEKTKSTDEIFLMKEALKLLEIK